MQSKKIIGSLAVWRYLLFALFLGRGWKYLFFETSYREIFWNKNLFAWFVEGFCGLDWNHYLSNALYDNRIEVFEKSLGVFFVGLALLVLVLKNGTWLRSLLLAAFILQLPEFYFSSAGLWFNLPRVLEFVAQGFSPLLVFLYLKGLPLRKVKILVYFTLAITFSSHAYYALNIFKVPKDFYFFCYRILGLDRPRANVFLAIMGWLDVLAVLCLVVPRKKWVRVGLFYMLFWGFLTALARPVAYYYSFDAARSLFQHFPDFLIRTPHYMLALWMLLLSKKTEK